MAEKKERKPRTVKTIDQMLAEEVVRIQKLMAKKVKSENPAAEPEKTDKTPVLEQLTKIEEEIKTLRKMIKKL